MAQTIDIGNRAIGAGNPTLLVAEIAQAHEGSVALAHSYIDVVADMGADAVKFQTHIASSESTDDENFRISLAYASRESRYDYWTRTGFDAEEWQQLYRHATDRDLIFLSSPFSTEAAALLENLGVPAWKVASGELKSEDLVSYLLSTRKPLLISTGMSTWLDIDSLVGRLHVTGTPFGLLQATSRYPTPLAEVGLNVMDEFRERYDCPVGLSDHSGTVWPALAAMAQGAAVVEVHVIFDRRILQPDASSSVTLAELNHLARARDAFFELQAPINKNSISEEVEHTRRLLTKSLALKVPLPKGTVLTADMVTTKKPGTGLPASALDQVVGKRLRHAVSERRLLRPDDLDG